jgi:hypothetical protein
MGKTKKQIMAKSVVAFSLEEFDSKYTRVLIGNADFGFTNFTDLGTLEVITGNANFSESQVENLGNLTTIGGDAYFRWSQVKDLGNLTEILGSAYFVDRTDLRAEWEKRKNK